MTIPPRFFLCVPLIALCALDLFITLTGQNSAYWAGDRQAAIEANPIARACLHLHPLALVGFAAPKEGAPSPFQPPVPGLSQTTWLGLAGACETQSAQAALAQNALERAVAVTRPLRNDFICIIYLRLSSLTGQACDRLFSGSVFRNAVPCDYPVNVVEARSIAGKTLVFQPVETRPSGGYGQ